MSPDGTGLKIGRPIDLPFEDSQGTRPVRQLRDERDGLEPGRGLCLSGGRWAKQQDSLDADSAVAMRLADTSTRLHATLDALREQLINRGNVIADAGGRSYVDQEADRGRLPYPVHRLSDASAHGA